MARRVLDQKMRDNAGSYVAAFGTVNQSSGSSSSTSSLQQSQLEKLYRTDWLCRNVVDLYAKDMTSQGVEWLCEADAVEVLEREFRLKRIWSQLCSAIKWARLYGGAIAVINMADHATERALNAAAPFEGLMVYDRYQITPDLQKLRTDAHAGEPAAYTVSPLIMGQNFRVDCSRVIRFIGNALPDSLARQCDLWGDSVIQSMYDRVQYYQDATVGANELLKRSYLRYLGIKDFWQVMCDSDGQAAQNMAKAVEMINAVQNITSLTVSDREDTFSSQQYSFSGIKDILDQFGQQIAGATGIPLVRLFGMSPSGFSTGEADLKNYYQSIASAQEETLREPISRLAQIILENAGMGGRDFDFKFISMEQPTQLEKAQAAQTTTQLVLQVYEAGLITPEKAVEELKRQAVYSGIFSTLSAEDVTAAKLPEAPDFDIDPMGTAESEAGAAEGGTDGTV